ncbi:hypothetical protein BE08_13445 [Sorangium cellulosum]|uniref:Bacterial transcription activator effector binding domain-containing protein n=1 Tax=Sorangium cellulosum TaxID=56 RepID=A0A150PL36_SORCE|nr:hypothetical protein BE08_13445 [Sorangium cellulosum]
MSSDEITPKPPRRPRARGAGAAATATPTTMTDGLDVEETWRQTCRALVAPLDRALTLPALRAVQARLAEVAARQGLAIVEEPLFGLKGIVEEPLFGLKGDPGEDPPQLWAYEAVLPIRGAARPEGDVTVARVEGGMYLAAIAPRGLDDLASLYGHLLRSLLPGRKQRLVRPYILHRAHRLTDGQERAPAEAVAVTVYVPAMLSMDPVPMPADDAEA